MPSTHALHPACSPTYRQVEHPSGADNNTAEWEACSILDGRPDYAGDALMGCTAEGCTPHCIAKVLAVGNLWQSKRDLLPFTCMNNIFMTYGCDEVRHEVTSIGLPSPDHASRHLGTAATTDTMLP